MFFWLVWEAVCILTLLTFVPTSLQVWNFAAWAEMPMQPKYNYQLIPPLLCPVDAAAEDREVSSLRMLDHTELQTAASQSGQIAVKLLPVVDTVLSQLTSSGQVQAQPGDLAATAQAFAQLGEKPDATLLEQTLNVSLPALLDGDNPIEAIELLEKALPAPAVSIQARQLSADFYIQAADAMVRKLDKERGRALRERALAATEPVLDMLQKGGEKDPALALMATQYYDAARALSRETAFSVAERLEQLRATLPDSAGRAGVLFALGDHELITNNNPGVAYLRYYDATKAYDRMVSDGRLGRGAAVADRVSFEWAALYAKALASTDRDADAVAAYDKLLREYTPETAGGRYHDAWMQKATSQYINNQDDTESAYKIYQEYLTRYPAGSRAPEAMLGMAWLYKVTGDTSSAVVLYGKIAASYPSIEPGVAASEQLATIDRHGLLKEAPEAEAKNRGADHNANLPLCGPLALAAWFDTRGEKVTAQELAEVAGTGERGTTMRGLIQAAKQHGLELCGVEAESLDALSLPAIAFVHNNHFVLVTGHEGEIVRVVDMGGNAKELSLGDFGREWSGKALVQAEAINRRQARVAAVESPSSDIVGGADTSQLSSGALKPLNEETVANVVGGQEADCVNQGPPCDSGDCECSPPGCGGGGGGGGAGGRGGGGGNPPGDIRCVMAPCPPSSDDGPGSRDHKDNSRPDSSVQMGSSVQAFQTSQLFSETDLAIPIKGGGKLKLDRRWFNSWGWGRGYTTDVTKVWGNNIGNGWVHGFNMHLVCSETVNGNGAPDRVAYFDQVGTARYYEYQGAQGNTQTYVPSIHSSPLDLRFTTLTRDAVSGRFTLHFVDNSSYEFSAQTGTPNYFARLETMTDRNGNTVSLTYNGAVGVGRLVQVFPPQGDSRYFEFAYDGNGRIGAAYLKKTGVTNPLKSIGYTYQADRLAGVSYDDGTSMLYEYALPTSTTGFNVTRKVDRGNLERLYQTEYGQTYWGYQAKKISYTAPDGLVTTYERDLFTTNQYSTYCLTMNYDGNNTALRRNRVGMAYDGFYPSASISYQNPNGTGAQSWSYTYDTNRRITQVLRPDGIVYMDRTYTTEGRLATVSRADGRTATWTYDSAGNITQFTDFFGVTSQYTYDSAGRKTSDLRPGYGSAGVTYEYNADGQLSKTTDPIGFETTYDYDGVGNLTSVTRAANGVVPETTAMTYDDFGRMVTQTNAANETTTYAYDDGCMACGGGKLASITYPNTTTLWYTYDAYGRLSYVTDPANNVTSYTYDAAGRIKRVYPPNANNAYVEYTYDALGRQTAVKDVAGKMHYTEYDYLGRVARTADHNNATISAHTYNCVGQELTVTDGRGNATTRNYTNGGDLYYEKDALNKYRYRSYDSNGRLAAVYTTGNAVRTEYAYATGSGFLSSVTYKQTGRPDATVTYTYDDNGRLWQSRDWNQLVGTAYGYDAVGRLAVKWDVDAATIIASTYDSAGRLINVADNSNRDTDYAYNNMGWLTQVAVGTRAFNYTYDTVGRRTQLQYPNGMTANYGYDTRGRLTDIHYKNVSNVTLERYTQTYDTASNITQVVDAANAKWDYVYDDRYRLTQAERRAGTTLKHRYTYGYDGADNVTAQAIYDATAGTTNSIAYTYNVGNELTQAVSSQTGTTTYAYDSWGRLTTITQGAQSATLGWAYQDRLKSYTTTITGETSVNYTYSGDGRRTGVDNSIYGQGPKTWTYDTRWGVRSQNYTNTPANSSWYILEPNGTVLAEAPATGVVTSMKYYFRDHLGSTRSTRREDTTKSVSFEYEPYGKVYASSGLGQLFTQDRFTGHEYDYETNMYWAPYRNYRPDMLRWISRDPLGMVDGPNVCGYVKGRPTRSTDSMGAFVTVGGIPDTPYNYSSCDGCEHASPVSAGSGACSKYGPEDRFLMYDAKCVCENAGETPWDQAVRGCLACKKDRGVTGLAAHSACYMAACLKYGLGDCLGGQIDIGWRLTGKCLRGPF